MTTTPELPNLPDRPLDAHKGSMGRVLIIAGSRGMSGAAALAGRAALRSGAGLVCVATAGECQPIVASLEPCYTTFGLAEDEAGRIDMGALESLLNLLPNYDSVASGPGLGQSRALRELTRHLIAQPNLKLVLDADGLNNLCRLKYWPQHRQAQLILTPHPGEVKRLWSGLYRSPLPEQRATIASTLAQDTGAVIVLKGAGTIVADANRSAINQTGNPGMATAGAGDVLTGIIATLYAQGLSAWDAARLGVHIHGHAGDRAAEITGVTSLIATDIIDALPQAF